MYLTIILLYKRDLIQNSFHSVETTSEFVFRSNSGRNNRKPYVVKENRNKRKRTEYEMNDSNDILSKPFELPSFDTQVKFEMSVIQRIHPNRTFAFQVLDNESEDVTFLLIGENLQEIDINVYFVEPIRHNLCQAKPKVTLFREKEFYVPSLRRLFQDMVISIPEQGLVVDVIFLDRNNVQIPTIQQYIYLNMQPTSQFLFYGNEVPSSNQPLFQNQNNNFQNIYNIGNIQQVDVIDFYQQSGLDYNKTDRNRRTVLHQAVLSNFYDVAKYAINKGCNVDAIDNFKCTALHYAAYHGRTKILGLLIEHSKDINIKDCNGDTALDVAISHNMNGAVGLLLQKKTTINEGTNSN